MSKLLIDHLEVCAKLARADGQVFLEYLIEMAITEAKRPEGKKAA